MGNERDPLEKVIRVTNWMLEAPGESWGVREIARGLKLPPSTVHRILTALAEHGLVRHDDQTGLYGIGLEFFRLAWRVTSNFPLRNIALPLLQELVQSCNETTFLAVYNPQRMQMMFIASVESDHPLRYVVTLHQWLPVYVAASGHAIMAFLPEAERRAIISRTRLEALTPQTIIDPARLSARLTEVRERGYARSRSERIPGAVGLAAPIWGPDRRVMGDVVLTVPEYRFEENAAGEMILPLIQCANRITEQLGGGPPEEIEASPATKRSAQG